MNNAVQIPIAQTFDSRAEDCPVESAIETISGRWKLLVLRALFLNGDQRFNRLLETVPGISAKELTRNLRELEYAGLVAQGGGSGAKGYGLTSLGQSLLPVFKEIGSFGERLKEDRLGRRSTG